MDDSLDTWKERFLTFEESSRDLIEYYTQIGSLWRVQGDTSDEITPKLFRAVESRFC